MVHIVFYVMGLYLHNAINTEANIQKITGILIAEGKKRKLNSF